MIIEYNLELVVFLFAHKLNLRITSNAPLKASVIQEHDNRELLSVGPV